LRLKCRRHAPRICNVIPHFWWRQSDEHPHGSVTVDSRPGARLGVERGAAPERRADGFDKFLVSYDAWRDSAATANPGRLNAYIYQPDQRDIWGDHFFPTGIVLPFSSTPFNFGPQFTARLDVTPPLGQWHCYEMMVKANVPGQRDGRVAFWLDGQLIADFPNLRLRETTALKIDRFTIDLHVFRNNLGVARKWYDNVVAATSYIGPMAMSQPLTAPTGLRVVR
jgi:hypothetical protein